MNQASALTIARPHVPRRTIIVLGPWKFPACISSAPNLLKSIQILFSSVLSIRVLNAPVIFTLAISTWTTSSQVLAETVQPCRIEVVERGSGWPVPLVMLETTHRVKLTTDNAGRVAFDLPELMGCETWVTVRSDGYEARADGFGYRGARFVPKPGETVTIEVDRTCIAKRLGRITGAGLFVESQKLGLETDWRESGVLGSDSVQLVEHDGKLFWAWGDTTVARYPLGVFDMSSATTPLRPLASFEPPLRLPLKYFTDDAGRVRGVAKMKGAGPTWLGGYTSVPDRSGKARLVATYSKIRPPMETYEMGLCVWNEKTENFEHLKTVWEKSTLEPKQPPIPGGHPNLFSDESGKKWLLFGNPLPELQCPATFEAWQDPQQWKTLKPQEHFTAAIDGKPIKPSFGSIAWNEFRHRWVCVFTQTFGAPSALGEVWYAESNSPHGPWGPAVKVLSHANYTFYNPRLHPELTPADSSILLFEGTYSVLFARKPEPTPRYDYNQLMYRLDLDDPALAPAQGDSKR